MGDQSRNPGPPGPARAVTDSTGERGGSAAAVPPSTSPAAASLVVPGPLAATGPEIPEPLLRSAAGPGAPPAPVEPMHGGHRFTAGGSQMWIAAAAPAPAIPPAYDSGGSRSAQQPGRASRPLTNGHDRRVGRPVGGMAGGAAMEPVLTRPAVSGSVALHRSIAALDPISDGEAAAFAARFAADYLSFDEDDPSLRAQVLRGYLADPRAATLGWSSLGRQRCDIVLPGRTLRTGDGTVVVEVTARVTPYRRDAARSSLADPAPDLPPIPASTVGPSCAPSAAAPGWIACPAQWVRIAPPVRRSDTGALVVDLGCAPASSSPPATPRHDHHDPRAPRTPDPAPDSAVDGGPS